MARAKKKPTSVKVNFKGVESRRTPAEGDYLAKVLEAEQNESSKGNDQIAVISEIASGEYKGSKLYQYFPLSDQSLWKLHSFLTALGMEVPEDEMDIDLSELVDLEFMAVVAHDTYQGKKQAKIVDVDVAAAYDGADDDKKSKKDKKGKKDKDEEKSGDKGKDKKSDKKADKKADKKDDKKDDKKSDKKSGKKEKVEKYDEDDIKGMDKKALKGLIKKHDLDADPDDFKTDKKLAAAIISELEDLDLID